MLLTKKHLTDDQSRPGEQRPTNGTNSNSATVGGKTGGGKDKDKERRRKSGVEG